MKSGYVALIGRPNVGKSTLLNYMLGEKIAIISDKPQTTRTSILGIKTTDRGQIVFVDNPGIHKPLHKLNKRMMSFVYSSLETADLVNLLIDATQKFGHGDEFVMETLKKISTPIFLLINKVDIIKKEKILLIIDHYKELLDFKEIIPISALRGTNVDVLEDRIYEFLPEAEKIFPDDEKSVQSQRFLLSEIIREKLLSHVKQELPWVTAVYIDAMDDDQERFSQDRPSPEQKPKKFIKATIFVEKDTHRRIIIGRHGQIIKAIGTEARMEMEKILGEKVFLDLWVKVKENWRDKADVLDLIEGQ
ncbi:MAG: GTPase Era [Candidatus Aminicenantes bacterium]|nr:GTPase Era [Candidatus Aminicenantes bacterium]MDH5707441.1 GTPase Era [Candidatus Aminicenantes bacterium]